MRNIIGDFARLFLALVASVIGLTIFTNSVYSPDTEALIFPAKFQEKGINEPINVPEYSLTLLKEEIRIKKNEVFEPLSTEYVQAQLSNGTDISNFIVVSGVPENTSEPGVYELVYFLRFEGSTDIARATLHITN